MDPGRHFYFDVQHLYNLLTVKLTKNCKLLVVNFILQISVRPLLVVLCKIVVKSVSQKMSESADMKLKQLRATRGYTKASITRLHIFAANTQEVSLANIYGLQAKQARNIELFKE